VFGGRREKGEKGGVLSLKSWEKQKSLQKVVVWCLLRKKRKVCFEKSMPLLEKEKDPERGKANKCIPPKGIEKKLR